MGRKPGPPPTPNELHRHRGNPSHKPMPDLDEVEILEPADGPPEVPAQRPLGPPGLELWERLWTAGRKWLAAKADFDAVLMVCESMDERVALRQKSLKDPTDWRLRNGVRKLDDLISQQLGDLGFNPAGRARLGVAEVAETPQDDLADLRAKREARLAAASQ